jgi:tRNA threonylcarbamoyl adenosine modification protein YeaZ
VLVLAFDTSTPAVTVALIEQATTIPRPVGVEPGQRFSRFGTRPTPLAERTEIASNRHGELLAPLIAEVLAQAGATPSELTAIGVGLGPGPFTGLRVGIVTAKAMGDALSIPVYGECSLDIIASELGGWAYDDDTDSELEFVVMSDARRKQVYWARYSYPGYRIDGPEINTPVDLAETLRGQVRHLGGHGATMYADAFADFTVTDRAAYPSAATLADRVIGKAIRNEPGDDLTPLYLRRPDAQPPGRPKQVTPA